jgi:hypothetical protein
MFLSWTVTRLSSSASCGEVVAEDDALASDFDDCPVKVLDRHQVTGALGRFHAPRMPARSPESRRGFAAWGE